MLARAINKFEILISKFQIHLAPAHVAQSVEHILGKNEVSSSILLVGSSYSKTTRGPSNQITTPCWGRYSVQEDFKIG